MEKPSRGGIVVPDPSLSGGNNTSMMQDFVEMQMIEAEVVQGYTAPGQARTASEVEWVRNTLDGSIMMDHKGYPVSVNRMLATKPLRAELSSRPGPGGKKLTYLSGEGVTRTLNDIFGFDGWNLEIVKTQREQCVKDDKGRYHVAYTAHVRLTHKKSGVFKEDVGASDSIDRQLGTACAHAIKGSITDALKRAARHFGEKLGNTLYQGDFSISKAPLTLRDALDMYDKERAATKFGPSLPACKPPPAETPKAPGRGDHRKATPVNAASGAARNTVRTAATAPQQKTVAVVAPICRPAAVPNTAQQCNSTSNSYLTMPVAKTPCAASNGMKKAIVSATPANNKFRNHNDAHAIDPPKLQLPPARQNHPSNPMAGVPPPPMSAAERLRNQSSMFGGSSFGSTFSNAEKENAIHNGQQSGPRQRNGMLVRPTTSSGRKSLQGSVSQAQQQVGLKRSASLAAPGVDLAVANKKMNSNPYANFK